MQLHKAWLERRAMMKAQDGAHNNTEKLYYFNKLLTNQNLNSSAPGFSILKKHKKFRAQQNEVIIGNDSSTGNITHSSTIAQTTISNASEYTTIYPITTPFELTSPAINLVDTTLVVPPTLNGTKHSKAKKDRSKSRRKQVIWAAWQPWSECSRSCGSGVMSQRRDCIR